MQVKDIMMKPVISVKEDTTLQDLATIFVEKKISGVPVVDEQEHVVGIISEGDLLKQQTPLTSPMFFMLLDAAIPVNFLHYKEHKNEILATRVGELMTKSVMTVRHDKEVSEAAKMMLNHKINRLPVVDDEDKLIGIITRQDIIRHAYL